jgi:MFS family permease
VTVAAAEPSATAPPAAARRRRGLAPLPLLTAINFVNYFDRQIMYGLFPLVGRDLALSDTALGALGFGNLLVYAVSSLLSGPATRRFGTRPVIATGVTVWSLATLGSALAPNYGFLLVMRALVGVGEGAFGPSANALLCADAPLDKRGRALGIYNVGMALGGAGGGAFALLAAGVLAPVLSWRGALLVAGVPGFVLALTAVGPHARPCRVAARDRVDRGDGGVCPLRRGVRGDGADATRPRRVTRAQRSVARISQSPVDQ